MMRDPRGFYGQYPAVLNVSYVGPPSNSWQADLSLLVVSGHDVQFGWPKPFGGAFGGAARLTRAPSRRNR
jgi:hypothetical protein